MQNKQQQYSTVWHPTVALAQPLPADCPLSRRQLEILALSAQGYSNGQVGRALGITVHTIKVHCQAIYTCLAINRMAGATVLALAHGWLVFVCEEEKEHGTPFI